MQMNTQPSALFQFKVPVLHVSRLGASPGFSDESVASAKTAHPKIKLEQCTSLWAAPQEQAGFPSEQGSTACP
jgi:hypothetical protein